MHESLKHAILHEFPALPDAAPSRQQVWTGAAAGRGIEGFMLRTCVDYFLLADFGRTETIPDAEWVSRRLQGNRRSKPKPGFSGISLIGPPVSSDTDPFGAFFHYASCCWKAHLRGAPADLSLDKFSLDDFLELASPASARHRACSREYIWQPWDTDYVRSRSTQRREHDPMSPLTSDSPLYLVVRSGNVSMLAQQLDRLAQKGDGDRRLIVAAATTAIRWRKPGHFRALMNHQSTATAMQTVEMLESFVRNWQDFGSDDDQDE